MTTADEDKLSPRELLLAFDQIQRDGARQKNGSFRLGTLCAEMGFDGYTVTISDEQVAATVGFHNSLSIDARSKLALQQFKQRIDALNSAAP